MPELYMILARKIINIPEFYGFGPKMPEFYIITARNIFFPNVGGGARALPAPHLLRLWRGGVSACRTAGQFANDVSG